MESLPVGQNDVERLNAEPATGPGTPIAQDTPPQNIQPQMAPPSAKPALDMLKKSHKKRYIIIATLLLLSLTAGAIAAIMIFSAPKKDTGRKFASQATKPLDDAQGMITKINTALTDSSNTGYQNPQISFTSPTSTPPAVSPSYQVSGADYYVTVTQAYGLNIQKTVDTNSETGVDTVFTQGVVNEVASTFVSSRYHKTIDLPSGVEYQSDAVICTVSGTNSIPIYVTCANKNAYVKVSSDVKPFVTAYQASNSNDASQSVFSAPIIKSNSTGGYQTAGINMWSRQSASGAGLIFYRKNNGDWKFFTVTQNELSCSKYNTGDLKAAFADESCMSDANVDTTVKNYVPGAKKVSGSSSSSLSNSTTKNDTTYNSGAASSLTNP